MPYTAYSITYSKVINVAGGGLSNGNAYANIEIQYKDAAMDEISRVFYVEYGRNPSRELIGYDIEWGEDDTFKVLDEHGNVVDDSDDEDKDEDDSDYEDEDEDEE